MKRQLSWVCVSILASTVILGGLWAYSPLTRTHPPTLGGTTMEQMEANKKTVREFYDVAINKKDYEAALKYIGPRYVQHNPLVGDGKEGFKAFLAMLRKDFPQAHSEIKRILADGDYVLIHVHSIRIPGTRGRAIFDLFKFENGKIVEHWDTIQDIPEKSANPNGMF